MNKVSLVDYGIGNMMSVYRALKKCGADINIINNAKEIDEAHRLVLPGVGAFGNCYDELELRGLSGSIRKFASSGKPLLGICVGMQILFERGYEFGEHEGLKILQGEVIKNIRSNTNGDIVRKTLNIGWRRLNLLHFTKETRGIRTILTDIKTDDYVYFLLSFNVRVTDPRIISASSNYDELEICAVVESDNIFGCQFHPEKSGLVGLKILNNFLNICF